MRVLRSNADRISVGECALRKTYAKRDAPPMIALDTPLITGSEPTDALLVFDPTTPTTAFQRYLYNPCSPTRPMDHDPYADAYLDAHPPFLDQQHPLHVVDTVSPPPPPSPQIPMQHVSTQHTLDAPMSAPSPARAAPSRVSAALQTRELPCDAETRATAAEMVRLFCQHIESQGDVCDRDSMSGLIKHALPVRGVKMLRIRYELHAWYKKLVESRGAAAPSVAAERLFAFKLMESRWYEDKVAAILFMQEVLLQRFQLDARDLPNFAHIFVAGHIGVYKVADHLAEKVLFQLAQRAVPRSIAIDELLRWTSAADLWQARSALAALAHFAADAHLQTPLLEAVAVVLARPEDEAKSIAGAALRALSQCNKKAVVQFLTNPHILACTSVLALTKATSRLSPQQQMRFKEMRRDVCARRRGRQ